MESGCSNTSLWDSADPMVETMPSPTRARMVASPAPPTKRLMLVRTVTRAKALTWIPSLAMAATTGVPTTLVFTDICTASRTLRPARSMAVACLKFKGMLALSAAIRDWTTRMTLPPARKWASNSPTGISMPAFTAMILEVTISRGFTFRMRMPTIESRPTWAPEKRAWIQSPRKLKTITATTRIRMTRTTISAVEISGTKASRLNGRPGSYQPGILRQGADQKSSRFSAHDPDRLSRTHEASGGARLVTDSVQNPPPHGPQAGLHHGVPPDQVQVHDLFSALQVFLQGQRRFRNLPYAPPPQKGKEDRVDPAEGPSEGGRMPEGNSQGSDQGPGRGERQKAARGKEDFREKQGCGHQLQDRGQGRVVHASSTGSTRYSLPRLPDRKSTRLNSSHANISY